MPSALDNCARGLLETAPLIMRTVRKEMRSRRGPDLSVPQFRSLSFIRRNADASLSHLAEHLGLTLPSTSKLIDGLVKKNLVVRQESTMDRRRMALALTKHGNAILAVARAGTQAHLTEILRQLPARDLDVVYKAVNLLHPLFAVDAKSGESRS